MDHYRTLGVPYGASESDIKRAFRKLAHLHHPDKGGDAEKFKEISKAYSALTSGSHIRAGITVRVTNTHGRTNTYQF